MTNCKSKAIFSVLVIAVLTTSLFSGCSGQGQETSAVQSTNDTSAVSQAESTPQESSTLQMSSEQEQEYSDNEAPFVEWSDENREKFNVPADYQPTSNDAFEYSEYNNTTLTGNGRLDIHGIVITKYTGTDTDVRIPVTITEGGVEYTVVEISDSAFANNTIIKSVTVPNISYDGRSRVLHSAFRGCTSLEKATLYTPFAAQDMFNGCTSLKEVVMCNKTEKGTIEDRAFSDCSSLKEFICDNHMEQISGNAFNNCSSLEKAVFNGGVESVTGFQGCSSLKTFEFKDTRIIKGGAFEGCTSLTEITIPEMVEEIGSRAFYNCTNLKKITVEGKDTQIGSNCFGFYPTDTKDYEKVEGLVIYNAGKLSKAHAYAVAQEFTSRTIGS